MLAAELGTSRETLSPTLARLRNRRLISGAAKAVTAHNANAPAAQLRRNLSGA